MSQLVLITGVSSGISAETARRMATEGWQVVPVAHDAARLQDVATSIGAQAHVERCDAADGDAVLAMAARVRTSLGVPDVIGNCTGLGRWERIEDTPPDEARSMIGAPYLAAFNVTHAFMTDRSRWGTHPGHGTWCARGSRPGSPSRVRRLRRSRIAATGKPGRSLCQDLALLLQLANLTTQPADLFPLSRARAFLAGQRLATVDGGLADPVGDGLRGDVELARELGRRAPGSHQLDHLLSELRRVRRSDLGHLRLLEHKE
jgi:hypothetical protein